MDAQRRARAEQTNISYSHRRSFIGGSDARIIMGNDDAALIQYGRRKSLNNL
jgi:predicted phage-related endonuclease